MPWSVAKNCLIELETDPLDIASFVIALVLVALMLVLIVRLPLAIMGNLRAGHRFRESLAAALGDLRLSRMLRHLGIDRAAYLHDQQALEIRKHMQRCDACDAKARCDETLQTGAPADVESLGFCANIDDLKDIRGRD
jgi:hypothetical protein